MSQVQLLSREKAGIDFSHQLTGSAKWKESEKLVKTANSSEQISSYVELLKRESQHQFLYL